MGITLADDRRVDIHDILSLTVFHSLDGDCDTMRDLLIQGMKCFLTDKLRNDLTLRLIRDRIHIIKHRSFRQILKNQIYDQIRVLTAQCGRRYDLREIIDFAVCIDIGKHLVTL